MTDTSPEYIDMCDCPEVQGRWKPKHGDWYWDKRFNRISLVGDGDLTEENIGVFDEFRSDFIHLPDQQAIQEWLGETTTLKAQVTLLYQFCFREHVDWKSHEQLWLAFFMDTVHGLTWKDGKWA